MSEEKTLCGALISDKMYATGDLQNVKIQKADSKDSKDSIAFLKGEDYQSPIAMQISVRSDENLMKTIYFTKNLWLDIIISNG